MSWRRVLVPLAALAVCVAGFATVGLGSGTAPDVPAAQAYLAKTLDWFHTTQKLGGRGYSIAQTQKTNAYKAMVALGGTWPTPTTTTTTTTTTIPTTTEPPPAAALYVTTTGNNNADCTYATPCGSLTAAVARAKPGQTIAWTAGTYGKQTIGTNQSLKNLTCTPATPSSCVHIVGSGVTVQGSLEIHASDVWVDGGTTRNGPYGITVTGYTDTEADSSTSIADHVIVSGVHSTSFGVFNSNTVTFMDMDVGPATVSTGCEILQGPGIENKIGAAGGITSPIATNTVLDGLVIHDQTGDMGRIAPDCHFGGLFLQSANGLLIEHTVFHGNVVYNVQIQNFGDTPPANNVTFDHDSFGCAVNWIYQGSTCDGQDSIQFDGASSNITIKNTAFGEPLPGWGCYVTPCDFSTNTFGPGNTGTTPGTTVPPPLP